MGPRDRNRRNKYVSHINS